MTFRNVIEPTTVWSQGISQCYHMINHDEIILMVLDEESYRIIYWGGGGGGDRGGGVRGRVSVWYLIFILFI